MNQMLVEHLKEEFSRHRAANKKYSLRAFARELDEDSSTLSALMRGKRPVTAKTAARISSKLLPNDPVLREQMIYSCIEKPTAEDSSIFQNLVDQDYAIIHSWEHFAILSLLETKSMRSTARTIARRLGIEEKRASAALDRLARLGLIRRYNGSWRATGLQLTTTHDVPSAVLRQANRQYIEKSLVSLELDPLEARDITGITMAIDPHKIPEAKKMLKLFRRRLSEFLEDGDKKDVYRLNLQLFPLSRSKGSRS